MDADAIGTWIGIGLSVAGFAVVWIQLRKTQGAAEAARQAVVATESRLASNHLLVLLAQLQEIETEIDSACASEERAAVIRSLTRWRNVSSEVLGILKERAPARALAVVLRESTDLAAAAKSLLIGNPRRSIQTATAEVRAAIGVAATECSAYLGQLRAYTDGHDE